MTACAGEDQISKRIFFASPCIIEYVCGIASNQTPKWKKNGLDPRDWTTETTRTSQNHNNVRNTTYFDGVCSNANEREYTRDFGFSSVHRIVCCAIYNLCICETRILIKRIYIYIYIYSIRK